MVNSNYFVVLVYSNFFFRFSTLKRTIAILIFTASNSFHRFQLNMIAKTEIKKKNILEVCVLSSEHKIIRNAVTLKWNSHFSVVLIFIQRDLLSLTVMIEIKSMRKLRGKCALNVDKCTVSRFSISMFTFEVMMNI